VVVDIREFMSSLPSILHQSGFKIMARNHSSLARKRSNLSDRMPLCSV